MATKKVVSDTDVLKSIDSSLKDMNEFLQGEFLEKVESIDWKLWEMHNRSDRTDKILATVEDVKSLLRVHLMNDKSNSDSIQQVKGKPNSIVGKLFKK